MGSKGSFWRDLTGGFSQGKDDYKLPPNNMGTSPKSEMKSGNSNVPKNEKFEGKNKSEETERREENMAKRKIVTSQDNRMKDNNKIERNDDMEKNNKFEEDDISNMLSNFKKTIDNAGSNSENKQAEQKNKEESQVDKVKENSKETIITKSTIIAGNISTEDDLVIEGSVCGDVDCKGKLTISGEVSGNAVATSINICTSKFEGDVRSDGKIEINEGTVIIGNIYGDEAVIAGAVKGEIVVSNGAKLESSAIVKGNIRAKSVQIDNGAVLQGFCELLYSSGDLDSFFGEAVIDKGKKKDDKGTIIEEKEKKVEIEEKEEKEVKEEKEEKEDVSKKVEEENMVEVKKEEEEREDILGALVEMGSDVGSVNTDPDLPPVSVQEINELEQEKDKYMKEMEDNYSNFMDQLKIDSDN